MKNYLTLLTLATLVACNGNSGSGSKSSNISNLKHQRGMVIQGERQGEVAFTQFDANGNATQKRSPLKYTTKEIYLSVHNNDVYVYEEETDFISNETTRSVRFERMNIQEEMKKIIDDGTGKVLGNKLYITERDSYSENYDNAERKIDFTMSAEVNMMNPICEGKVTTIVDSTLISNGIESKLTGLKTISTYHCSNSLTSEELKQIDLSSIEFCDTTQGEDYSCEQNQNLEHLTSDL